MAFRLGEANLKSRNLHPALSSICPMALASDKIGVIMAKAQLKTRPTKASVDKFLKSVTDPQQRADALKVVEMMKRLSGEEPVMWGPSIIGFGSQMLKYATGRELDWPRTAFSPRKGDLALYVLAGRPAETDLLKKLGPHKHGISCLLIKRLADVDQKVLEKLIKESLKPIKTVSDWKKKK